jgi:hypothetical protein
MHSFDVRSGVLDVFRDVIRSPFFLESSHEDEEGNPERNVWSEDPSSRASLICIGSRILDLEDSFIVSDEFLFSFEGENTHVFVVFVFRLRHIDGAVFPVAKLGSVFRQHHGTLDAVERKVWGSHGVSCSTGRW